MEGQALADLSKKELAVLKEFLGALTAERESIISFSLEGIVRENNRKEEILKRLRVYRGGKGEAFFVGSRTWRPWRKRQAGIL